MGHAWSSVQAWLFATEAGEPKRTEGGTPSEVLELLSVAYGTAAGGGPHGIFQDRRVSDRERESIPADRCDLTYGELLPRGLSKALGVGRLEAGRPEVAVLLELGMGIGNIAVQCFAECPNLQRVLGVELCPGRYAAAERALRRLAAARPHRFGWAPGGGARAALRDGGRALEVARGDLLDVAVDAVRAADVILLLLIVPRAAQAELQELLCHAKDGCRVMLYDDLALTWGLPAPCPWHRLGGDAPEDVYATSWRPDLGSHFFLGVADRRRPPSITARSAEAHRRRLEAEWALEAGEFFAYYEMFHEAFARSLRTYSATERV